MTPQNFTKVDLTPKRYHGYAVLLFIFGTLFPPLGMSILILPRVWHAELAPLAAVAARFGLGGDFWLNLILTICGYIPGVYRLLSSTCHSLTYL